MRACFLKSGRRAERSCSQRDQTRRSRFLLVREISPSDDDWLRLLVHAQAEYIGARVVPHDIEVVFPARDVAHVQVGGQDRFAGEVGTGEDFSKWRDNAAATPREDRIRLIAEWRGVVIGIVGTATKLVA